MKNKNKGMGLVEMIVAIGIFSIGMAGFTTLFAKSWQINRYIYETGQDSFIASRGVSSLVNDIRRVSQAENGDYPIKSADDFDLVMYIDIDNDNRSEKVHFYLDQNSDELKRGVSEPSSANPPTYNSGDDTTTIIASHIVNDSSLPLFSYFGNNYLSNSTPIPTPVSLENINVIRLVKISIWADIRPYTSPDHISIESFAQMRNLKDYEE